MPHVLEVAVVPGLTDTSVFPFGATAAGESTADWASALVEAARHRP